MHKDYTYICIFKYANPDILCMYIYITLLIYRETEDSVGLSYIIDACMPIHIGLGGL